LITRSLNPDWYRVRYNLTALHATWSASLKAEDKPTEAEDHRSEAHSLSRALAQSALEQFLDRKGQTEPPLKSMLETSIVPSALLIYAGTSRDLRNAAAAGEREEAEESAGLTRRDVRTEQEDLQKELEGEGTTADKAVDYALAHGRPTPRFLYNVACLYSQAGKQRKAAKELADALERSSESEASGLAVSASKDPSLIPLMNRVDGLKEHLSDKDVVGALKTLNLFSDDRPD
jgi:hypothetical protein